MTTKKPTQLNAVIAPASTVSLVFEEIRDGLGLSLTAAGKLCGPGRNGRTAVNGSTVFRWCRDGVRGPTGQRVKLEFCRIGRRLLTTGPAIERFVLALSDSGSSNQSIPRSPSQACRASEKAAAELEKLGC